MALDFLKRGFGKLLLSDRNHLDLLIDGQGVVDFVSVGDKGTAVVDFKTNNWKDENRYIANYATQLNMYSQVLGESLGLKVQKKYLYSFTLGKFIEV